MKETEAQRQKQREEKAVTDGWNDFWKAIDKADVVLFLEIWGPHRLENKRLEKVKE